MQPTGYCKCGCGLKTPLATHTRTAVGLKKGEPTNYIRGHHMRPAGPEYAIDEATGCWVWLRALSSGYGVGWDPELGRDYAHRLYYRRLVGAIPDGLVIDHLCRRRSCVNPAHMEVITNGENVLRGEGASARAARASHCKRGHLLSGENLYLSPDGRRGCLTCRRRATRESHTRSGAKRVQVT